MTLQEWLDDANVDEFEWIDRDILVGGCLYLVVDYDGYGKFEAYARVGEDGKEITVLFSTERGFETRREAKVQLLRDYKMLLQNQLDILKDIEL